MPSRLSAHSVYDVTCANVNLLICTPSREENVWAWCDCPAHRAVLYHAFAINPPQMFTGRSIGNPAFIIGTAANISFIPRPYHP